MVKTVSKSVGRLILGLTISVLVFALGLTITLVVASKTTTAPPKSAYEIAVENGFEGTEAEWLASLKTPATKWMTGDGLPSATTAEGANEGDFYINLNTHSIYRLQSGTWNLVTGAGESTSTSTWNGKIPGWQAPDLSDDEVIKNRPASYVVDTTKKTVDMYNADAFAWFAYRSVIGKEGFKDYTVTLRCDIDLADQMWIPIGIGARSNAAGVPFQGTFDGNGHTIYNLNGTKFFDAIEFDTTNQSFYIPYSNGDVNVKIPVIANKDREVPYGLFATTKNATIKNLNIENIDVQLDPIAKIEGDNGFINNGQNDQQINGYRYSLIADSVATFVGFAHGDLTLQNLRAGSASGNDVIRGQAAAGIVARVYCGRGDEATPSDSQQDIADGRIGSYGKLIIENCTNYVNVCGIIPDGTTYAYNKTVGNDKTGGILCNARYYSEMLVSECENYGTIEGHFAGGIIGARQGTGRMLSPSRISKCNNYGKIVADEYGGGIIGYRLVGENGSNASYVISDCNNYGMLEGRKIPTSATETKNTSPALGGIVGLFNIKSANAVIVNCANYGDMYNAATAKMGGIVGQFVADNTAYNNGKLTMTGCVNAGKFTSAGTVTTSSVENKVQCYGVATFNGHNDAVTILAYTNVGSTQSNVTA